MKKLKNILLVDDDTISSWLNQAMLERSGLVEHVETISDGKSAINRLQAYIKDNADAMALCPDIVLLDLDMPVINGFDVLEALQNSENTSWLISDRVIVLTTSIYEKDMERAKAFQISDFLVKPLTETKIKGVLERFLSRNKDYAASKNQMGSSDGNCSDRQPIGREVASDPSSKEAFEA